MSFCVVDNRPNFDAMKKQVAKTVRTNKTKIEKPTPKRQNRTSHQKHQNTILKDTFIPEVDQQKDFEVIENEVEIKVVENEVVAEDQNDKHHMMLTRGHNVRSKDIDMPNKFHRSEYLHNNSSFQCAKKKDRVTKNNITLNDSDFLTKHQLFLNAPTHKFERGGSHYSWSVCRDRCKKTQEQDRKQDRIQKSFDQTD